MLKNFHSYFFLMLIFVGLLDCGLIFLVKLKNFQLKNKYYNWHIQYGFKRVVFVKIMFIGLLAFFLLTPLGIRDSGFVETITIIYYVVVGTLLIDFWKK